MRYFDHGFTLENKTICYRGNPIRSFTTEENALVWFNTNFDSLVALKESVKAWSGLGAAGAKATILVKAHSILAYVVKVESPDPTAYGGYHEYSDVAYCRTLKAAHKLVKYLRAAGLIAAMVEVYFPASTRFHDDAD